LAIALKRVLQRYFQNRAEKRPYKDGKAIWHIHLYGIELRIVDSWESKVPNYVFIEINRNELGLHKLRELTGNILDIGGQVGMVSIYLSKLFPSARVHSYEAFSDNHENFLLNIELNKASNVSVTNKAITGDGRLFFMNCNRGVNTGGSTGWSETSVQEISNYNVESDTLDEVIERLGEIDLIKIDCEGAEYEILSHSKLLDKVESLIGEFHFNDRLTKEGYAPEALESAVRKKIRGHVCVKTRPMSP